MVLLVGLVDNLISQQVIDAARNFWRQQHFYFH